MNLPPQAQECAQADGKGHELKTYGRKPRMDDDIIMDELLKGQKKALAKHITRRRVIRN